MLKVLNEIIIKKSYWILLIFIVVSMESVALYYQYALDEWPCVLCIHVRILFMILLGISITALFAKPVSVAAITLHGSVIAIMAFLLERSWILLGVERGTIFGSCNMDLGLPAWLAIDKWLPFIFEVKAACGYTPVLFAGITMAEALIVFSFLMLILSVIMLILVVIKFRHKS